MAFFIDKSLNAPVHVDINADMLKAAYDARMSLPTYINRQYPTADTTHGSAFSQLCASVGLVLPGKNDFGIAPATMADILDGKAGFSAAVTNSSDKGDPFGQAARVLAPSAIIALIEDKVSRDYSTDVVTFSEMIGQEISISGDNFIQPKISFQNAGGAESTKRTRSVEFGEPNNIIRLSTAEVTRSLPTYTVGMEFSDKALRSLTLDVVAMTLARYRQVQEDSLVYDDINALWEGDSDLITGAVSAVTSNSLDTNATGGAMTQKAWLLFLARNRRYRKITHVIGDINAYHAVMSRTGRYGTNSYDPSLVRVDPQIRPMNVTFGDDVRWMIVDTAAEGGPVPANTVYAADSSKAITRVSSTTANYSASEQFALRRSTMLRFDVGSAVYRTFGDTDLKPFDVLTIS